ncbi:hypothetical protein HKCCE2091_19135 [Rhodobacterales bacterium HKCCE2091]|nr:hypothetical protein [Rhodobacterales bacterium HKCCE2091]
MDPDQDHLARRSPTDGGDPAVPVPPPLSHSLLRIALRLAVVVAIAVAANALIHELMALTDRLPEARRGPAQAAILVAALAIYAVLIALPFVPGIEIGMTLLLMNGQSVAPFVYAATVAGLSLAYATGRLVPERSLRRLALDLRLVSLGHLFDRIAPLGPAERLDHLRDSLPGRFGPVLVRWRYVLLAVLINTPGNGLLGGGGGLSLLAGLSRAFLPLPTLVTFALAVAPVPLLVWFLGPDIVR